MHTKAIGEISEAFVIAEFIKAGFPVLLPFGENQRYDMAVDNHGRLLRVQCKTATLVTANGHGSTGCLRFNAHSVEDRRHRTSYRDQADLFAVYAPHTGQVYVLAVDDVPETAVHLRLTPARNGQQRGVRLAEDHTLAAWVTRLAAVPQSCP